MWVWAVSYSSWETASGSFGFYFFFSKKKYLSFSKWLEIPYRKLPIFFFFVLYTPVVCVGKHIQVFLLVCLVFFAYNLFALFSVTVLWWLWVCWVLCNPAMIRFSSICAGVLLQGICFLTKVTFQWRFCGETQLFETFVTLVSLGFVRVFYRFICGQSRNFPGI